MGCSDLMADVQGVCEDIGISVRSGKPKDHTAVTVEVNVKANKVLLYLGSLTEHNSNLGSQTNAALDNLFLHPPYRLIDRTITLNGVTYSVERLHRPV
jgi:hypothetical protein